VVLVMFSFTGTPVPVFSFILYFVSCISYAPARGHTLLCNVENELEAISEDELEDEIVFLASSGPFPDYFLSTCGLSEGSLISSFSYSLFGSKNALRGLSSSHVSTRLPIKFTNL